MQPTLPPPPIPQPAIPESTGRQGTPPAGWRTWTVLAATLVVIVLLTGGWTRLARLLPDAQSLPADTTLTMGGAQIELAASGWQLSRADTEQPLRYVLTRNRVRLIVDYVEFPLGATFDQAWTGFDKLLALGDWDVGRPQGLIGGEGNAGQTADIRTGGYSGTATIFRSPDADYGVELLAYASNSVDTGARQVAEDAVRTVGFAGGT